MVKEEDRLALIVKIIDNESHIIPRGYFYKLPNGNIVKAPYFKGIIFINKIVILFHEINNMFINFNRFRLFRNCR